MAARFWVNGAVDDNWSTIGNWSLTSGGAGGQAVPTSADDVTIDANSGHNMVLNTSARVCKSLTTTAIRTITFDQQLSVSGLINLVSGQLYAGATTNKLRMIAAGTWTINGGTTIPQDVEIGGTTTFTCTLATVLPIGGNLTLTNTTSTIFSGVFDVNVSGNVTVSGTQTITVVDDWNITGLTTISDACVINGAVYWRTGGLTTTGNLTGTTSIILTGGTWTGAAGSIANNITFEGDVTVSGTVLKAGAGTINPYSGTLTTTGSILSIAASCAYTDFIGASWNNIILTAALTLTLNSVLTAAGTFTLPNAAVTFNGGAGFTVATLTMTALTASRVYTFANGVEYTVTTAFTVVGNLPTVTMTMISDHASIQFKFTLRVGATQDIGYVVATRVDSSLGQQIVDYRGTLTTATNWTTQIPPIRSQYRPTMGMD